jgi:putative transcriptional regulator
MLPWRRLRQERKKGTEMGKFGDELIASMTQAATHAGGRKVRGMRVTRVEIPDVKAIRRSLRMSQHRFAAPYRIPLPTLKNWEQGRRRTPTRPRRRICSPSSGGPSRSWKLSRVECGVTTDHRFHDPHRATPGNRRVAVVQIARRREGDPRPFERAPRFGTSALSFVSKASPKSTVGEQQPLSILAVMGIEFVHFRAIASCNADRRYPSLRQLIHKRH